MATNQEVQEAIKTLTDSIASVSGDNDRAFVESFSAAIAQHDREEAAAKAAAAASALAAAVETPVTTGAGVASSGNVSAIDVGATTSTTLTSTEVNENTTTANTTATTSGTTTTTTITEQLNGREELQRIAEQYRQEQKLQAQQQEGRTQASEQTAAQVVVDQDEVLQQIASVAVDTGSTLATVPITSVSVPQAPPAKPVPGSDEWHKMRRDNHKEVERRRRETINEGINEIAKAVPNCDKNKGSILRQAVKYIQTILAENERLAAEKELLDATRAEMNGYILEKSVSEATFEGLSKEHERLKKEYEDLRKKMDELEPHAAKKQRTE